MMPVTTDGGRLTPEQTLTKVSGVGCAVAGADQVGSAKAVADANKTLARLRNLAMTILLPVEKQDRAESSVAH
jgi:hypothetical protein